MQITLRWDYLMAAAVEGARRQVNALRYEKRHQYGLHPRPEDLWALDIDSCCGEAAVAQALGVPYAPEPGQDDETGDVAGRQVRSTPVGTNPHLILHPRDFEGHVFVLVAGWLRTWTILGWKRARDVFAATEYADRCGNGRPAFWYPSRLLETSWPPPESEH
jgi:hypothetical protein